MSKNVLRVVVGVAAIALNFIPGLGTIAALGLKIGVGALLSAGLTLGASILLKPKMTRVSPNSTQRLHATMDPGTPRKIVFGDTALATDVRYQSFTGSDQEYYHQILCVASHEVSSVYELWFDSEKAWSAAGGVTSKYSGYLTVEVKLVGTSVNTVSIDANWGAAQRLTGCAYLYLRFKLTGNSKKTESPFSSAIPTRVTVRGKAALLPDIREASVDAADQATWAWVDDDSGNNPALQLLYYLVGWRINGKLAVGRGVPVSRIDLDSFITAANLCDEPVTLSGGGTEPRYRSAGVFSEGDDPGLVIGSLTAAMNAVLRDDGGQIALHVLHNDLATPVADFTEADILGDDEWQQTPPVDEIPNVVRGRYVDPSDAGLYQLVEFPEVSIDSVDDIERIDQFDLAVVQSAAQAQRLAKQRLQRHQYRGTFTARFNERAWQVNIGDPVRQSHRALGWTHKIFRVASHTISISGEVVMTLQEEHADIYAWDAEESPAVVPAVPTAYDPLLNPFVRAYYDVAGAGPQMLRDDTFVSSYWEVPTPGGRAEWSDSRSGFAASIPFQSATDYRVYSDHERLIAPSAREGQPVFARLVADPAGFSSLQVVDDDGALVVDEIGNYVVDAGVADFDLEVSLRWLDIDGAFLSRTIVATLDPAGGVQEVDANALPPAGAAYVEIEAGFPSQTGKSGAWTVYEPWVAEYQPTADNTHDNQVVYDLARTVTFTANHEGVIDAGQTSKVITPTVTEGGVDIRDDDKMTYALANIGAAGVGAVSVNNTTASADKGRVTLTDDLAGPYTFDFVPSVSGVALAAIKVTVNIAKAQPPTTSAPGGGGGSGGGTFSASGALTTTSFVEIGRCSDVDVTAGQTISGTAPISYLYVQISGSGSAKVQAKWQYSLAGAESWTDFDLYVEGSPSSWTAADYYSEPGYVSCSQNIAPSAGSYDVRLVAASTNDAGSLSLDGSTCSVTVA